MDRGSGRSRRRRHGRQAAAPPRRALGGALPTAAVGFAIDVPTPGVNVEPWIAPGLRMTHVPGDTRTKFGIAGGLTVGFGMLGVHAALDYESLPGGGNTKTLGIGAHFSLRPSFGL